MKKKTCSLFTTCLLELRRTLFSSETPAQFYYHLSLTTGASVIFFFLFFFRFLFLFLFPGALPASSAAGACGSSPSEASDSSEAAAFSSQVDGPVSWASATLGEMTQPKNQRCLLVFWKTGAVTNVFKITNKTMGLKWTCISQEYPHYKQIKPLLYLPITPQHIPFFQNWLWLLLFIFSVTVPFEKSHKEAMCAGLCDAGTKALSERLLATFRPLRKQRHQPGGRHANTFSRKV